VSTHPTDGRASRIICLLNARLTEQVELRDLAKELGVSVSTAGRLLRVDRGVHFLEIRTAMRVEAAIALIREDPWMKVDAVAWSVGWRSRRTLYMAVKRVTGRHLAEFRSISKNSTSTRVVHFPE
jgi:transcriptional regulator GlxA family with amidase domain